MNIITVTTATYCFTFYDKCMYVALDESVNVNVMLCWPGYSPATRGIRVPWAGLLMESVIIVSSRKPHGACRSEMYCLANHFKV